MTVRTSKKYERKRTIFEMAEIIREELKSYPEIINYSVSTSSGGGGGMGNNNVSVEIYGYDFDETNILANELKHKFKELGWIVTIVVCTSTATAITLIPMLCSKMLKANKFFVNKEEEKEYLAKQKRKIFCSNNKIGKVFSKIHLYSEKLHSV